jgi:hypothetical protein
MAGSKTQHLLWGLALGALTATTLAQRTAQSTAKHPIEASAPSVPKSTSYRLLTSDDGLAIIGAALESRHLRSNGDCSHLVHAIYELAGFRYRYADSSQLYDGIGTFRQVTHPQPGDLAVWRGHAAIVINPAQHSFFGSTRSGLRVESYESEYWKRRGSPRFFRYLKPVAPISPTVKRTATAEFPDLRDAETRPPLAVPRDSDDPPPGDSQSSAVPTVGSSPRVLVVHAPQPDLKKMNEVLFQNFEETDRALRGQDMLKLPQPLIVFDHIEVKGVHLKGNHGWTDVKINGLCSLVAGRARPKKRSERHRWVLIRRDTETWELLLPPETNYLPGYLAVRVIAHQLAAVADRTSEAGDSSQEQAQLARTLNLILEK